MSYEPEVNLITYLLLKKDIKSFVVQNIKTEKQKYDAISRTAAGGDDSYGKTFFLFQIVF